MPSRSTKGNRLSLFSEELARERAQDALVDAEKRLIAHYAEMENRHFSEWYVSEGTPVSPTGRIG